MIDFFPQYGTKVKVDYIEPFDRSFEKGMICTVVPCRHMEAGNVTGIFTREEEEKIFDLNNPDPYYRCIVLETPTGDIEALLVKQISLVEETIQ